MWLTSGIPSKVGASQQSVDLIISLLISYPICIAFNTHLITKSKTFKLFYYLLFGLSLIYLNYGLDLIHSLVICLFCYLILSFFSIKTALVVNFIVPLIYLLYGCYITQIGSDYSITWTLPQCLLTLRLIAITFDVYDGFRNRALLKRSKDNEDSSVVLSNTDTAIDSVPTLLEFLSHCYFPATILVGPLISYRKYIDYIDSNVNHLPNCWTVSLGRLLLGAFYLAVYQIGSHYWSTDYLLSPEFSNSSYWYRLTAVAIVSKICMSKYLSSWLISEGACIASGIAFDGKSYYSCANIDVIKFETTPTFDGVIKSFNLKTNIFAAKYIFKRLKFFGNRTVSHALTLLFLSIWHGIETGYLMTFIIEFLIMKLETEMLSKINKWRQKSQIVDNLLNNLIVKSVIYLFFRIYTIYLLGYSFVPLMYVKTQFWYPVLRDTYFYGHIITISWIFISILFP